LEVHCLLRHSRDPATVLRLATSRHERRAECFLDLLEKHFERAVLPAPATALAVHCERVEILPPENLRLLDGRAAASSQWPDLLGKHVERAVRPAPATALAVHCERVEILPPENLRLLDGRAAASSQWPDLLDRLRARLGEDRLSHPRPVADHRPEFGIRVRCG